MAAPRCRPLRPVMQTPPRGPQSLGAALPLLLWIALVGFFCPSPMTVPHAPLRASAYYVSEEGFFMDGAVEMPSLRVTHSITLNEVDVGSLLSALQLRLAELSAVQSAAAANATALQATVAAQAAQIAALQAADATISNAATALTARVTNAETAATALTGRVTAAETAAVALANRVSSAESAAASVTTRVGAAETAATAVTTRVTAAEAAATTLAGRVTAAESAATALATRVGTAEGTVGSHTTQITSLQTADTTISNAATTLTTRVTAAEIAATALTVRMSAAEGASTALSTRVDKAETLVVDSSTLVTTVLAHTANISTLSLTVANFQSPTMYRYSFTTSQAWTVPSGVRSAWVTMAGGGGSGFGWRISNAYQTGHSGGYIFSTPVSLVAGETLTITVGKGGVGSSPVPGPAVPNTPYSSWVPPPNGDDGLAGYPGTHSSIVSPSLGEVLRCDGGSGATPGAVDAYDGTPVAGGLAGATVGLGSPPYPAPNRPAVGPYATVRGPGACGPNGAGIGNEGMLSHNVVSGAASGGLTPFGHGSGGGMSRGGCWVSTTVFGTCISTSAGRDGVVYIDVMY